MWIYKNGLQIETLVAEDKLSATVNISGERGSSDKISIKHTDNGKVIPVYHYNRCVFNVCFLPTVDKEIADKFPSTNTLYITPTGDSCAASNLFTEVEKDDNSLNFGNPHDVIYRVIPPEIIDDYPTVQYLPTSGRVLLQIYQELIGLSIYKPISGDVLYMLIADDKNALSFTDVEDNYVLEYMIKNISTGEIYKELELINVDQATSNK